MVNVDLASLGRMGYGVLEKLVAIKGSLLCVFNFCSGAILSISKGR